MKVYEDFILSIGQCSTNNKFCSQYIFECICKRLRISNIFVTGQLTEYEYRIYSFLATWPNTNIEYILFEWPSRIQISNIFVTRKLSIRIRISDIRYQIFEYSNIRIFEYICVTLLYLYSVSGISLNLGYQYLVLESVWI